MGVLVEYTRVVLPAVFFNRVEIHLKQLGYYKVVGLPHGTVCVVWWLYVGALLGVWGIIVLVLPSH